MTPTLRPEMLDALSRAILTRDRAIVAGPIPDDVITYWREKRLKPSFSYLDTWREEHDVAFVAAKVMRVDVLDALHDELDRAIADGVPYKRWIKEIEPRLTKLGWWAPHEVTDPDTGDVAVVDPPRRLKLIFDTNTRMAHAVGQWDRIQQHKAQTPFLLYGVGPSKRHREQHLAWHGLLLPVDDPFWKYAYPPNGWNCRCHVRALSVRERDQVVKRGVIEGRPEPILDDEGIPTGHVRKQKAPVRLVAPPANLVPFVNRRTGKTEFIPEGIDPGFNKTPGEGRAAAVRDGRRRVRDAQKR